MSASQPPAGFIRMTNQRRVIMEVLKSTNTHPTAEWVFEKVRERLPNISLATVYNNLRRLVETGEIQALHCGLNQVRYDSNTSVHAHFICEECHGVTDLNLEEALSDSEHQSLESLLESLGKEASSRGYIITAKSLKFYGNCPRCEVKNSR